MKIINYVYTSNSKRYWTTWTVLHRNGNMLHCKDAQPPHLHVTRSVFTNDSMQAPIHSHLSSLEVLTYHKIWTICYCDCVTLVPHFCHTYSSWSYAKYQVKVVSLKKQEALFCLISNNCIMFLRPWYIIIITTVWLMLEVRCVYL